MSNIFHYEDFVNSFKNSVGEPLENRIQWYLLLSSIKLKKEVDLEKIKFVQSFPKDILDLPPNREIEFSIDLMSQTGPISIAPYKMPLFELTKLKGRLVKLLGKSSFGLVCHLEKL